MTTFPKTYNSPDRIVDAVRDVARRQRNLLAAKTAIHILLSLLIIVLVGLLFLGVLPVLPLWGRLFASLLVWGAVATAAIHFIRPLLRRQNLVMTALHVEHSLARQGIADTQERIATGLQLSGARIDPTAASPELVGHLVSQAQTDADGIDVEAVAPTRPVKRLAIWLIPLVLLWVLLALVLPSQRFSRPLVNLLMPWRSTPAFSADILVEPGDFVAARGDPVRIVVRVHPTDPDEAERRIELATIRRTPLEGGSETVVAMNRTGPRSFDFMGPADQSFRFRISTDGGDSRWFTATVQPVPAIAGLSVRYEYPAYTGLAPKVVSANGDGAIDAPRGTHITLSVQAGGPVGGQSQVVLTSDQPPSPPSISSSVSVSLRQAGADHCEAAFVAKDSGTYRVELQNAFGRKNADRYERPITVQPDLAPVILMTEPAEELVARPDDAVPIKFEAEDDFGLARLELLSQVDGSNLVKSQAVEIPVGSRKGMVGETTLDLAEALDLKDTAPPPPGGRGSSSPRLVTFWLRATDNRQPEPQSTESERQTVRLDKSVESLAVRRDRQAAKDFTEAIKLAIRRLDEVRPEIDPHRFTDRAKQMNNVDRRRAAAVKEKLELTAGDLIEEADRQDETPFANVAAAARQVAERRILHAAEQTARIDLHSDDPALRMTDALQASQDVVAGRNELDALLKAVEEQAKLAEARRKLEDLARRQEELNQEAAPDEEKEHLQKELADRQNQLRQQTQQVISDTPQLRDPQAQEQSRLLYDSLRQVTSVRQRQSQLKSGSADRQLQLADQSSKAARSTEKLQQSAEVGSNPVLAARAVGAREAISQAETAQRTAAEAEKATKTAEAAAARAEAEQLLAAAEEALRGQLKAQKPSAAESKQPQAADATQEETAQPGGARPRGEASPEKPQQVDARRTEEASPSQSASPPVSKQQAMRNASQAAAEATDAQQDSARGNESAGRQAADALHNAIQSLAQAAGQGQGEPGEGDGQAKAQAQRGEGQQGEGTSSTPGEGEDPNEGVGSGEGGQHGLPPPAVAELGVTPSTWTRLAPLQQQELLNAARQSGPVQYQTMIKNYYVRLARTQSPASSPQDRERR